MAVLAWVTYVGRFGNISVVSKKGGVCNGIGVGEGKFGSVIKARTAAWATAWRCVGVGEGNIESVSKNRRRGPFPAAEGATAWATTWHRVGIGEGKGISVRKTGSVGPSLEVAASGGVG